jgi:hypothetical protein
MASCGQALTVRTESDAIDFPVVSKGRPKPGARARIPELCRLIVAPCGNELAIGTYRHGENWKRMSQHGPQMMHLVLPAGEVHPNLTFKMSSIVRNDFQAMR